MVAASIDSGSSVVARANSKWGKQNYVLAEIVFRCARPSSTGDYSMYEDWQL